MHFFLPVHNSKVDQRPQDNADNEEHQTSNASTKRTRRKCNIGGCTNRVAQGGLCISHAVQNENFAGTQVAQNRSRRLGYAVHTVHPESYASLMTIPRSQSGVEDDSRSRRLMFPILVVESSPSISIDRKTKKRSKKKKGR